MIIQNLLDKKNYIFDQRSFIVDVKQSVDIGTDFTLIFPNEMLDSLHEIFEHYMSAENFKEREHSVKLNTKIGDKEIYLGNPLIISYSIDDLNYNNPEQSIKVVLRGNVLNTDDFKLVTYERQSINTQFPLYNIQSVYEF